MLADRNVEEIFNNLIAHPDLNTLLARKHYMYSKITDEEIRKAITPEAKEFARLMEFSNYLWLIESFITNWKESI